MPARLFIAWDLKRNGGDKDDHNRRTFGKQHDDISLSLFLFIALNRLKTGPPWLLHMSTAVSVLIIAMKKKSNSVALKSSPALYIVPL